mmetsp:Transcript_32245/g.64263  ORF Transcript_32245/g.64263 Transcript_32245/m.64263 type:complete len:103 (+) Transcript_32245:225-533(+)
MSCCAVSTKVAGNANAPSSTSTPTAPSVAKGAGAGGGDALFEVPQQWDRATISATLFNVLLCAVVISRIQPIEGPIRATRGCMVLSAQSHVSLLRSCVRQTP